MPTVLEQTDVNLDRQDLLSRCPIALPVSGKGKVQVAGRASGMHLSGVLRYIAVTTGLLKIAEEIDEELLPLRLALGHAWEEFAVSLYPEIDWQPGEITQEGISMNCDGIAWVESEGANRLDEFKLTWKRAKSAEEIVREQWYWLQQGRGYCWGYESRLVRWHVCFVNGEYKGGGPIYRRYLIRFTDQEIESTRKMILKHKDAADRGGNAE